ncbi:hypothetical protein K1719_045845 [Acacia pycnantha]|nr:hypothetical protein K1719_045845 [Acacia pycnantha]
MLSYPMRIGYEKFLIQWITRVYKHRFADDDPDFDSLKRRVEQLFSQSPLRSVQVLIPKEVMNGGSVSSEASLKHVPEPMHLLATHLALQQLAHTLTSHTLLYRILLEFKFIQNIWFSTRNDAEKQTVSANIQESSRIRAAFDDLEIIYLNQIDDKTDRELVLLNPATWLEQTTSAKSPTKNYGNNKCLFLVVDGDGDKKLDPKKVSLPIKGHSQHVVVFITSAQENDELRKKVDLTIKTEDHLLPWELFCNIAGSELLHSPNAIQSVAVQIVKKCGGHLLATILMAQSLKHVNDVRVWKTALEKLCYRDREAIVNAFFNIIRADVISKRENIRLLRCLMIFKFLDGKIMSDDELFDSWFSKQLVDTQEEAKSMLQNFLECSVLLKFEDSKGVHILLHEDIQVILHAFEQEIPENLSEGALESTISDLQVLNLSYTHMRNLYDVHALPYLKELNLEGCMLETLPEAVFKLQKLETLSLEDCLQLLELPPLINGLENLKTLKLRGCKQLKTLPQQLWELWNLEVCDLSSTQITHLPQFINLPKLISLLLGDNLNLMKIPSSIFDHVPLLSILNLSSTSIHGLPSSIFNLHGLKEFYLKDCELFVELPPEIRRLKNLETLDLDGTLITHLPKETQELTNLKSLSLSFYNDFSCAVIPLGVLSKLTHLEVLRIGVNSDNEWWLENIEHILAEINGGLKMLRALDMYIPQVNFSNPIKWCLSNFRFIIDHHKPKMISRGPSNIEVMFKESDPSLKFVNGQVFPDEVKSIISESWAFFLDRHFKINNLIQFGLKNLKQLRLCILGECNEMQSIVDMDEYEAATDLKESFGMQFLVIFYMKNLRSIINKPIHDRPIFCELKLLALHTCPELTTIFTMDSLDSLVNLEELIVEDCPNALGLGYDVPSNSPK